jgi:hypothetical protein
MDRFDQYVEGGRKLIEQHPDWETLNNENELTDALETATVDQIATILHGFIGRNAADSREIANILDRAVTCFEGDYEDIGMEKIR